MRSEQINKQSLRWCVVALLTVLVIITAIMTAGRLVQVVDGPVQMVIELVPLREQLRAPAEGKTLAVEREQGDQEGTEASEQAPAQTAAPALTPAPETPTVVEVVTQEAQPGFSIADGDLTWETDTEVDIFHPTYETEAGESVAVESNGDTVIAPGTSGVYTFDLYNTGNVSLDYLLETMFWFGDDSYVIPVEVRLSDDGGAYLVGDENTWVPVAELMEEAANGTGMLSTGRYTTYCLEWRWPFEGDDEADTVLGHRGVDEDVTLTVALRTTAWVSEDQTTVSGSQYASTGGRTPQTGDDMHPLLWAAGFAGCMAAVAVLAGVRQRKKGSFYEAA